MTAGRTLPTMSDQPFRLDQLAPAPPPPRRRRSWLVPAVIGLAIVALAGGIFAVTLDGKTPAAPATVVRTTAAPRTINISGTLTLARPGFVWDSTTSTCTGQNGYDDIHGGAQVVVTNPAGVTVAIGHLGDGEPMSDPGATIAYGCALPFSVTAPAGLGFYGVEISHRGRVQYGEKDVQQALSLTLG